MHRPLVLICYNARGTPRRRACQTSLGRSQTHSGTPRPRGISRGDHTMPAVALDRQHTALLIADFYAAVLPTLPHAVDRHVVEHTQQLQRAARQAQLFVCYCATVFRSGYIEISERNKTFSARKRSGQPPISDPVQLIHPAVQPAEGEVVVGKHRVNALYGTALDLILRANDLHTLIILGYATSGVVLST